MSESLDQGKPFKQKVYEVIFESDTKAGKLFDVALLILILSSVITIFLESIPEIGNRYHNLFFGLEIFFTIIFTIEYLLRLWAVPKPLKYAKSFYGVIDLISILPTYFSLIIPDLRILLLIRTLRMLRVFRIFKMVHFLNESLFLVNALWNARRKIAVFFFAIILMAIVTGAFMYVAEHNINDSFHSIPQSIYWAIVTLTTVGYGDISPITPLGKLLASFIMLLGYSIIAVPTGILSAQIVKDMNKHDLNGQTCPHCFREGHDANAEFCKYCGGKL